MDTTTRARIEALKAKAAAKQVAEDLCPGHIWKPDYVGQIAGGGSSICVQCGTRRSWTDAEKEGIQDKIL